MGTKVSGAQPIPHCPKSSRDMYEDPLSSSVSIQSFIFQLANFVAGRSTVG